ncbi:uncharacterized protein Z518_07296 [Rhinocladiella mackenziei CBS 650.93]|uniref:DUF6570 domain-containing protein n=1 Tax=Rhinocladiella mackenziei CBS 650.93 TaxID=1442369 RepID=A0A0D2GZW5_9EURO|nr:uncharacterized protein Z518_07296 [Rhinocladiella mackenziei CBS 650.93]KIX03743.1 hypothetical protein Z518_07296 [Rhinocladiella mackenziei CBS 650.93]
MDPGEIPAHLPALTQVEEMIIARSHVQMLVHRYQANQYHYSGRCVSLMQNNIQTVNMLPNLPSELDVVVLRPSNQVMENDGRYRSQFRADFRVRKGWIITWLRHLKANHPDYRYITISLDRLERLPVDDDISSSFPSIIDESIIGSYIDAFRTCRRLHTHPPDFYDDPEGEGSDSDDEDPPGGGRK